VDKTATPLESILRTIRENGDSSTVRAAIMDLGYEKGDAAYAVLLDKLDDPNPAVQHAAVISLGRSGRADAIEELIKPKIFRSPYSNIRWAAVAAIGRLGDYRVIEHLLKAVEDPEWIVRTQATTELKEKVQDIIVRRDARLTRVLIRMLSLDHEEIVDLAMNGLLEIGRDALPRLHEALANSSAILRANAARALGRFKSPASTPYLLESLGDEDGAVRAGTAEALGLVGDKAAIEPLVQRIGDPVEKVQDAVADAVVRFGKSASVPLLNALSREKDKFALRALLLCLGRIGDPKTIPALIGSLSSSYFVVRQTSVSALIRFGPPATTMLLPTLSYNTSDIEPLKRDACDREHPELQMRAVKALGGLEDHRAVDLLKELVAEGLPDVQEAATKALSQIGCAAWGRCCALKVLAEVADRSLVSGLDLSLRDDSDNVRFEAVRALARWGGPEAVRHIVKLARRDPKDFVRAEAMRALRTKGLGQPGVLEAALRGLTDTSRDIRNQSAQLLGSFHDAKSILPLLKTMADAHWSVRESAENALLNLGGASVPALIESLKSPRWTTRFRAARLLGEIGDVRAVPPLRALLARRGERQKVREIAGSSLHKLGHSLPA
jgi:HEAT repeat protein